MCRVSVQILLILSLSTGSMGCVYQGRLSIRRVWADFNTLNEFALYYEKLDHFPTRAAEVDHFRWMYNKGPNPRVPYQVIPAGTLEAALHPEGEMPAWDCPTCIPSNGIPPNVSPEEYYDQLPPAPGVPSQNRSDMLQSPTEANQSGNKGSFRPISHSQKSIRPSMTSNQPIELLSDEKTKNERSSALSRMNRWLLGEKKQRTQPSK